MWKIDNLTWNKQQIQNYKTAVINKKLHDIQSPCGWEEHQQIFVGLHEVMLQKIEFYTKSEDKNKTKKWVNPDNACSYWCLLFNGV